MFLFKTNRHYFDAGAYLPLTKKVSRSINKILKSQGRLELGNPFGRYLEGRKAKEIIDHARSEIVKDLGVTMHSLVFSFCVSEGVYILCKGIIDKTKKEESKRPHVIIGSLEHMSIISIALEMEKMGIDVTFAVPDASGTITPEVLKKIIKPETVLVNIQYVNSDTGLINPLKNLSEMAKSINPKVFFCSDVTQAMPYMNCNLYHLGMDAIFFDASKMSGPKGIAALVIKDLKMASIILENNHRKMESCSNVSTAFAKGFEVAYLDTAKNKAKNIIKLNRLRKLLLDETANHLAEWRMYGINQELINVSEKKLAKISPHISTLYREGLTVDYFLTVMDELGFAMSGGTACGNTAIADLGTPLQIISKQSSGVGMGIRIGLMPRHKEKEIVKLVQAMKRADRLCKT